MTTTLDIQGMHCPACVRRLTEAFTRVPGVLAAHVSLDPPRAALETDRPIALDQLQRAAAQAGEYTVRAHDASPAAPVGPAEPPEVGPKPSLYPLFLIVAYILGAVLLVGWARAQWAWRPMMHDFMAGFFLVFSFFKLLDIRGFVSAYRRYDLLAKAWPAWAWVYPFVELALGVAYLVRFQPVLADAVTLALMLVGAAGVLAALRRKQAIRCACLGTALNLPMTTVTLVEDLAMAAMAAAGLLAHVAAW